MQGFLSCAVCSSLGSHSTENCPRKAQRDLNVAGEAVMRDHRGEYNEMDLIYTHPESGSRLFLGNITASKNLVAIEGLPITHVINCMARNVDEALKKRCSYFCFPIETWEGEVVRRGGDPGHSDGDFRVSTYFVTDFIVTDPNSESYRYCFPLSLNYSCGWMKQCPIPGTVYSSIASRAPTVVELSR